MMVKSSIKYPAFWPEITVTTIHQKLGKLLHNTRPLLCYVMLCYVLIVSDASDLVGRLVTVKFNFTVLKLLPATQYWLFRI